MTSRKNINIFDFNGVNVAKHWHVAGEVFAISDCLVELCDTRDDRSFCGLDSHQITCMINNVCTS